MPPPISRSIKRRSGPAETPARRQVEQFPSLQRLISRHCAPMILVRPTTGLILYANEAAVAFYGYDAAKLIGMTVEELSALPVDAVRAIRKKAVEGFGRSLEVRHRLADGRERVLLAHSSQLNIDGEDLLLSILQDVTPLHDARDALGVRQQQLDMVVSASNSGIVDVDLISGELDASDAVWNLLGITRDRPRTIEAYSKLLHPDDVQAVAAHRQRAIDRRERFERRFRLRRADGNYIWVLGTAKAVYDASSNPVRYVGSVRDISFTMRIESDLRASESRYRMMFEVSPMPMLVVDEKFDKILEANDSALLLYRLERSEVTGKSFASLVQGEEPAVSIELMRANPTAATMEMRHRDAGGRLLDVNCRCCSIGTSDRVANLVMVQDLTQSKADADEIQRLATRDLVTDLPNRRSLQSRLEQAIGVAGRAGKTGTLIVVNLDSFRAVNETVGRNGADQLLMEAGRRLELAAGDNDTVARLQSDEFAILCHGVHRSAKSAVTRSGQLATQILDQLRAPYVINGIDFTLTASIGISMFDSAVVTAESVLKRGESAVKQAKRFGGDGLRYFDPEIQQSLDSRAGLELDLRRAVNEAQFELYYQLQVDQDAKAVGAEVLLRWNHPDRGLVPPFQFIELAEETGVIVALGQWVLEQACQKLAQWAEEPEHQHLRLSVNVSARQFRQHDFVPQVMNALAASGAKPEMLTLEITESLLLDYTDEAIEKMEELRVLGVGFSLDDFGTGYSSLAYLKKLPLDELKIDRGFIRDIMTDPNDAVIVRTIIGMAINLGLSLIAEGVECAGQHRLLTEWGCTGFQGYHFGRPQPYGSFSVVSESLVNEPES